MVAGLIQALLKTPISMVLQLSEVTHTRYKGRLVWALARWRIRTLLARIAWYASIQQEPNGWKTVTTQFYIQEFSEYIAPLQDAVDLEIATEEERSLLEAWNKYRVLLNRVDTSVALGMKLFVTHVTVTVITISKVQNVY